MALRKNPNAAQNAKDFGDISHTGVWNIAKAAGIELSVPRQRPKSTPETCEAVVGFVREGMTLRQAAKAVGGISTVTAWKMVKAAGVELPKGGHRRETQPVVRVAKDKLTQG